MPSPDTITIKGYTKKDGTKVKGYDRKKRPIENQDQSSGNAYHSERIQYVSPFIQSIGQDATLKAGIQNPRTYYNNATSTSAEREHRPFTEPHPTDLRLMYEYGTLARVAISTMNKDVLHRGFTLKDNNDAIQLQLKNLNTPQNPNWDWNDLFNFAMNLRDIYGWAMLARVPQEKIINTKTGQVLGEPEGGTHQWIVFSEPHVLEEFYDPDKRAASIHLDKMSTAQPDRFTVQFKVDTQGVVGTVKVDIEDCIPFIREKKINNWKGHSKLTPIYSLLVYIENILWGYSETIWKYGKGNYIMEWPKTQNLSSVSADIGSIGNHRTLHVHESQKMLKDRIHNLSLSGSIYDPTASLMFYVKLVCSWLEFPIVLLFGDSAGAQATSWVNDIRYEATLLNEQERLSLNLARFLKVETGNTSEIEWNAGKAIDEGMRADIRTKQLAYMTPNEVRALDDLPPVKNGDVLKGMATFNFNVPDEEKGDINEINDGSKTANPPKPEPEKKLGDE